MNDDVPQFFRLNVEVGNLDEAIKFYSALLGVQGRKQPGARSYFECGPVTLSVIDVSSAGTPHTAAKAALLHGEKSRGGIRTCEGVGMPVAGVGPR